VCVPDKSGLLQPSRDCRHRWPLPAQHDREELVAQIEILFMHSDVRHQEPAGAPLLDVMQRIAGGRLHHLCDDALRIAPEQIAERAGRRNRDAEVFDASHGGVGVGGVPGARLLAVYSGHVGARLFRPGLTELAAA